MSHAPPPEAGFLDALRGQAMRQGGQDAIRFLARGEEVTDRIGYAALLAAAEDLAGAMAAAGLAGQAVALAMPPGIGFVTAFLACLLARAIAIPLPDGRAAVVSERRSAALADARPALVLVGPDDPRRPPPADLGAGLRGATIASLLAGPRAPPSAAGPDSPAFIQYSSGSTRAPRGIVVTHGNLAANLAMIRHAFGLDGPVVNVSWLPQFHDMGLVGGILQPLHEGGTAVLMPPEAFIQRPLRWLRAIERHRAVSSGGPNFGYALCLRRITPEEAASLDLAAWRIAFCGAEPIHAATLGAFAARFAPAGFQARAFLPCYGMAEATLLVTACRQGEGLRQAALPQAGDRPASLRPLSRVSCGRPPPGCTVSIHDPETGARLPEGLAGEIWVGGPHLSPGCWSGETRAVLPLPGDRPGDSSGRALATGDLGMLVDGELVVLDRLKDVIATNGRKVHAADIEGAALEAASPPDSPWAAAAFSLADAGGGERSLLLCELSNATLLREAGLAALALALKRRVAERTGLSPEIHFLRHGDLPRTSSGKIQRHRARSLFAEGALRTHLPSPAGGPA